MKPGLPLYGSNRPINYIERQIVNTFFEGSNHRSMSTVTVNYLQNGCRDSLHYSCVRNLVRPTTRRGRSVQEKSGVGVSAQKVLPLTLSDT